MEIHSYADAEKALNGKMILELPGRETSLMQVPIGMNGIGYAINYRGTKIVTYTSNNIIILHDGGWKSVTTLKKMNSYLPDSIEVVQTAAKIWIVRHKKSGVYAPYIDSITIDMTNRQMFGNVEPDFVEKTIQSQRDVEAYTQAYIDKVIHGVLYLEGDVESLSVKASEYEDGVVGLSPVQASRLIKSDKYPPSLLERAVAFYNPDNPLYFKMVESVQNFDRGNWLFSDDTQTVDDFVKFARRAIKRLLNKSLGLPLNA